MQFEELPTGHGTFFKGADYEGAAGLLIEVTRFERQRPGNFGPKDTIHATIHKFDTAEDAAAGKATVAHGVIIQSNALVRDLVDLVGKATIATVGTAFFKKAGKEGAVWRQVEDAEVKKNIQDYGIAYAQKLEKEMDDAPDFE